MSTDYLIYSKKATVILLPDQPLNPENEELLWRDFRRGDVEAYALIYKKYFFVLYQYGKKISNDHELVKDSIQDLFIKIWNNRRNLKETTSIKYYLLTSLKRKLVDTLRGPQVRLESDNGFLEKDLFVVEDSEDEILEKKEEVLKALNKLSGRQQKLLHLKFYQNRSNQEIAEEMGITIQSVYNAVFKIVKSLRNQLSILISAMLLHL